MLTPRGSSKSLVSSFWQDLFFIDSSTFQANDLVLQSSEFHLIYANDPLTPGMLVTGSVLISTLVIPRVFPSKQYRSILLRTIHELPGKSDPYFEVIEFAEHTKNHIAAPRPVAAKRYKGRAG